MSNMERAVELAAQAHKNQTDKAGKPYILHVLRVAMNFQFDEVMFCAAILHDSVEDTFDTGNPVSFESIYAVFGAEIWWLVNTLTRRKAGMVLIEPLGNWGQGRQVSSYKVEKDESYDEYLRRIKSSSAATAIKIAELKDNMDPLRLAAVPMSFPVNVQGYTGALRFLTAAE